MNTITHHRPDKKVSLYDHLGRKITSTGYVASGSARRSMRGWSPAARSADADTIPKLEEIRASARDLYMNSPIATGALERFQTNVVGYGLSFQSRIDRKFLRLSDEQAEEWERTTEREFRLWAESTDCDAARTNDFYSIQALSYLSKIMSGDVFVLLPSIPRPGNVYDLRIRLLEADMVSNPNNHMDNEKIAGGIEVDDNGAPVTYHVSKRHPGGLGLNSNEWIKISAFAPRTGLRQVLHIFDQKRPGQRRGVPMLAPVIETLKMATRLSEAELMAAVVSSFFTVFVKSEDGENPLAQSFDEDQRVTNSTQTPDDKNTYEMGHGSVVGLSERESVELADPKRPNAAYDPFFVAMIKQVGSAIGCPFEVLLQHFASSYSASRAALLEAWKSFLVHRTVNVERGLCKPVYKRWLLEAVIKGRVVAPGFIENTAIREAWCGSKWLGQGQGQLNPVVETRAAIMRIEGGLSTYSKETALIDGDDWDSMSDRGAREEKLRRKKYGIIDPTRRERGDDSDDGPND